MDSSNHGSLLERAGLWAQRSMGALIYTVVFAAVVFVPAFLIVDRYPRRGVIRTLRVLGVVSMLLVPALIVWLVTSGLWQREVVFGVVIALMIFAGAALAFFRAAAHGEEVAVLRPQGDPVGHWAGVLREHPRWWIRSRAARELGGATLAREAAREALLDSRADETNRHVRSAIGASLRRLRAHAVIALLSVAVSLPACTRRAAAIDWARLEAEDRLVERPAGMDVLMGKGSHRWTDGVAHLELVPIRSVTTRGVRLTGWVSGARGARSRFILDTGSVGSLLSVNSALAPEVVLSRIPFRTGGASARGYIGHLPVMTLGGMQSRDVTVSVVTASEIPASERDIVGIVHLYHTQLEHRAGAWTLRSGRARLAATEPGWAIVRLEPGTPVVRVRGPDGRTVKALIDTGAYESFAVQQAPVGSYTLTADHGGVAHRFPVRTRRNRVVDAASFGGHEIHIVIGMDMLVGREWRFTPDEGVWAFAPNS